MYKMRFETRIKKFTVPVKQNISVRLSVTTPPLFACLINLAIDERIHVLLTALVNVNLNPHYLEKLE